MTSVDSLLLSGWFWVVQISLIFLVLATGLVVCLLRWNDGWAPRMGTFGFGLQLLAYVVGIVPIYVSEMLYELFISNEDGYLQFFAIANMLQTWLGLVGIGLVIAALRLAFRDAARWRMETWEEA